MIMAAPVPEEPLAVVIVLVFARYHVPLTEELGLPLLKPTPIWLTVPVKLSRPDMSRVGVFPLSILSIVVLLGLFISNVPLVPRMATLPPLPFSVSAPLMVNVVPGLIRVLWKLPFA